MPIALRALIGAPLCAAAFLLVAAAVAVAVAEDRGAWFKSLMQPDTGLSCCDISDCRRTEAEWRDGQWYAEVYGEMTPIPPGKVLENKPSIDGDAYVCAGAHTRTVYCFVKPTMGF